ncbi:dUTP diphosphatase [uncultured Megasphaera sp.]|uniref:dUTP diphosphatase n=1 Tax=uncultured Megasphaera sp. TaxID=165188 RepID=UPI0026589142|nr:dUTP diphosphatase [uncultured Megasphaera sp.]
MTGRGFEVVRAYAQAGIALPVRKTAGSAGYDLAAAETVVLPPHAVTVVPTGLKAYMEQDEYLSVFIRSSLAFKKGIMLANSTGIIDSDYYNNGDNEGHIMLACYNTGDVPYTVEKGDRIGQGIFMKYLTVNGDGATAVRTGGIGSTGRK